MTFMLILAALTVGCDAQAIGNIAEISIIDRDSGVVLTPHYYRGEYWVAGRPGARYAIEVRNRLGERLLAVTSVDGVNVLSGDNAGWDQAGYVFSPGERYQITGWRKSDAEVAAFTFTESPNSYAERTGRPANVGVIGVAVFRERQPQPVYAPPPAYSAPSAGASSPAARAQSEDSVVAAAPRSAPMLRAPAPDPKLGTGHGEREYSYVSRTDFVRMQPQPNEVIHIRYDSLDNLVAMGIVKRSRQAWPSINPFPASPGPQYVPDPPG
ncbi:MAG: hypothetical protein ACHQIL_04280 [Steroidobacterales bacterium]